MRATITSFLVAGLLLAGLPTGAQEPGSAWIRGTVIDDEGTPLADICVDAWGPHSGWSRTDGSGKYGVRVGGPGEYRVHFVDCDYPQRYASQWYDGKTHWEDADVVPVAAGEDVSGIDASLQPVGTISGTVTDRNGDALREVCVTPVLADPPSGGVGYLGPSALTDAGGRYQVQGMAPGDYHVGFTGCGISGQYAGQWYADVVDRADATQVTVVSREDTPGIDASLDVGGVISGAVADDTDGQSLANICIHIPDVFFGKGTMTGGDGKYTVRGLQAGDKHVSFYDCNWPNRRYVAKWYEDADRAEDATPVPVALGQESSGIDVAMTLGGSISGRVASSAAKPLDACVEVFDQDGSWVDWTWVQDGAYRVGGLGTGSYLVRFTECWGGYHVPQWYDGAASQEDATPVEVTVRLESAGIDAVLELGPAPDPAVTEVRVQGGEDIGPLETGSGRSVTVTVENVGDAANVVGGYLDVRVCPVTAGSCRYLGWEDVGGLEPGETREVTFEWWVSLGVGEYEVVAQISSWEDVDPFNNEGRTRHTVHLDAGGAGVGLS